MVFLPPHFLLRKATSIRGVQNLIPITSPHLTAPHLTSPHLTSPLSFPMGDSVTSPLRPLRALLPSTTRPRNEPLPPALRDRVASACDACRLRKIRCNGARPVCSECVKRSASCHYATRSTETQGQALKRKYDEMQRENEAYAELFDLIRTRPDTESHEILRRIKMGNDVRSVLKRIKEADLLIQLKITPDNTHRCSLPYVLTNTLKD